MINIEDKLEKVREFIQANPGKSNRWYAENNGFLKRATFYKHLNDIVMDRSIDNKTDNFTDKMDKKDEYIEIWKTAIYDGIIYEGLYKVSNFGKILSLNYNGTGKAKLLNPSDDTDGYLRVGLWKNGEYKTCKVHRLVAFTFLDNPENLPEINHKDENKTNNFVFLNEDGSVDKEKSNIEWKNHRDNCNHGTRNERVAKALSKRVIQLSLSGDLIKEWESTRECARNGFNHGAVAACCRGEKKQYKGFLWMYYDDYEEKFGYIPLF